MSHRQADGVIVALKAGKIARSDYMEITGVSEQTASRDLSRLVERKWLVPQGRGRGRYYTPNVPIKPDVPPEQGSLFDREKEA